MNFAAEEKLTYAAMKAICDSGIPVSFKGSMVLKACLMEAGFTEGARHYRTDHVGVKKESRPMWAALVLFYGRPSI